MDRNNTRKPHGVRGSRRPLMMGQGVGRQASGKGLTDIKRVTRSFHTHQRLKTGDQVKDIQEQQRKNILDRDFNRDAPFNTGLYAGGGGRARDTTSNQQGIKSRLGPTGGASGYAGRSYGGVKGDLTQEVAAMTKQVDGVLGDHVYKGSVKRATSRAVNRPSTVDESIYADQSTFQDRNTTGRVHDSQIRVEAFAPQTYSHLGNHNSTEGYQNNIKNAIKLNNINVNAKSGNSTFQTFEKYTPEVIKGNLADKIKISGKSGEYFAPQYEKHHNMVHLDPKIKTIGKSGHAYAARYEKYHNMKKLDPKISAKNVMSKTSTSLNNAKVKTEHYVSLTPNKPSTSFQQPRRIEKVLTSQREAYNIRHKKPDVSKFAVGSSPVVPRF